MIHLNAFRLIATHWKRGGIPTAQQFHSKLWDYAMFDKSMEDIMEEEG